MSRIGNKPVQIPAGVTIDVGPGRVTVNGPKGELSERVSRAMAIEQNDGELLVSRPTDRGEHRALHGLTINLSAASLMGERDTSVNLRCCDARHSVSVPESVGTAIVSENRSPPGG